MGLRRAACRMANSAGAASNYNEPDLPRGRMNRASEAISRRTALLAGLAVPWRFPSARHWLKSRPRTMLHPRLIPPETQQAIDRGLAWLARRQVISGREEGAFGHSGYAGGVAVSSLSGLAFMMSGSPPGQGLFGKQIDRCVRYHHVLHARDRLYRRAGRRPGQYVWPRLRNAVSRAGLRHVG